MKKEKITPRVKIVYKNDINARNKLVDYIINLLLNSDIKDLIESDTTNRNGDRK